MMVFLLIFLVVVVVFFNTHLGDGGGAFKLTAIRESSELCCHLIVNNF